MEGSLHREREIANTSIRCQNRIRFEAQRMENMVEKIAELDEYLRGQGVFEHVIKELSGKNAEVRACKKEHETVMLCCMINITEQITRQNWIFGDMLDFVASQMQGGSDRDCIQKLANAYHVPNPMVNVPCEATK